jgi:hypothetical protein
LQGFSFQFASEFATARDKDRRAHEAASEIRRARPGSTPTCLRRSLRVRGPESAREFVLV